MLLAAQLAAAAIVLPLTFENGDVLVDARVGDAPLRLIVDTGGKGALQLAAATLPKVNVAMTSAVETRIDAVGNEFSGAAFEVAEPGVGDAVFRDVPGFVRGQAAGGITGALPADGLLGMEFLRPYVARFDYRANSLTLYRDDQRAEAASACAGREIPVMDHPLKFWYSEATTGHGPFRLVRDSGATCSFISADVARTRKLPIGDDLYRATTLMLGTADYGPVDFVSVGLQVPDVDMLLGYNFFERHVICFNGPRSIVTIVN